LGYNIFDPSEVIPEYTSDIGIKKGEKVDYAITINKELEIIIEVKMVRSILKPENANQLLRYFGVTKAAFAILTNGIQYQFFSDLEKKNVMDTSPFLTVDLTQSIQEHEIK
jgi:predicted type IV restriction endonuclease